MHCLTKWRVLIALCGAVVAAPGVFAQTGLRINEVLASNLSYISNGEITDWVEIYNPTGAAINLAGYSLSDEEFVPKWSFPDGTSIPANSYLVVAFDSERAGSLDPGPNLNTGFSLKASGATLFFYGFDLDNPIDAVTFGNQVADYSIGRVGTEWKLCKPTLAAANTEHTQFGPVGDLRINEWFSNPSSGNNDWIEIFNKGTLPVKLSSLYLTDAPANASLYFQIGPLSFIGSGLQAFARFIADGNVENGPDHVSFGLSKGGETIALLIGLGNPIHTITFGAQNEDESGGLLPDGSTVQTTFPGTSSPGRSNYKNIPTLWVSEVLTHTDPPQEDAVEFYNDSATPLNIGGWYLSNSETDLKRYKIPAGVTVPAKGYKVFYENAFGFTINSAHGDQIHLAQADALGNLTGYRVSEDIDAAENGVSFGRVVTSVDYKFVAQSSVTLGNDGADTLEEFRLGQGAPNAGPKIGPIVINEVHFNPARPDETDNTEDEFIELYNTTSSPVQFFDPLFPQNRWRLQNGVSFVFPANVTVPAQGYALVVSFDPILFPVIANNFRVRRGVPSTVKLYGPFLGDLNNSGDSLELYRPDPPQGPEHPDAGYVPYIRVDKVNYTDRTPWPGNADATGNSIQRRNPRAFGNEPLNWAGAEPTAGRGNSPELIDTDGDGMTDLWEDANGFDKNLASDGPLDFDQDGFTNVQEFLAGTNPKNAASRLQIKSVVPATSETAPLRITFVAAANKTYSLQYRNTLAVSGEWDKVVSVPAEPTEREVIVEDTKALGRTDRYYRIVVE